MQLDILTPESSVFSGEVDAVVLPGTDGKFEIRKGHAAMIAALTDGIVKFKTGNTKEEYSIKSGIVEVLNNKVSILTEGVVL